MLKSEVSKMCGYCGYDLRGLSESLHCPECGEGIEKAIQHREVLRCFKTKYLFRLLLVASFVIISYAFCLLAVIYRQRGLLQVCFLMAVGGINAFWVLALNPIAYIKANGPRKLVIAYRLFFFFLISPILSVIGLMIVISPIWTVDSTVYAPTFDQVKFNSVIIGSQRSHIEAIIGKPLKVDSLIDGIRCWYSYPTERKGWRNYIDYIPKENGYEAIEIRSYIYYN